MDHVVSKQFTSKLYIITVCTKKVVYTFQNILIVLKNCTIYDWKHFTNTLIMIYRKIPLNSKTTPQI